MLCIINDSIIYILGTHLGQSGSGDEKELSAPHVSVTEASINASSVFILSMQLKVIVCNVKMFFRKSQS